MIKKIVLWFFTGVCILCLVFSFTLQPVLGVNLWDRIIFDITAALMFAIILFGLLYELNVFHLQGRIPFFKKRTVGTEIIFWFLLMILIFVEIAVLQNCMSKEYKSTMLENAAESKVEQEKPSENKENVDIDNKTSEDVTNEVEFEAESEVISEQVENVTWNSLMDDKDDYYKTIEYLAENFRFEKFTDDIDDVLSENGSKLVKELFAEYEKMGSLNSDFQETFTEYFSTEEYEDMFFEGGRNSEVFDMLSYSFVISWKSDGTYYIDLPEYPTEDFYEKNPEYMVAKGYAAKGAVLYTINDSGDMVKEAEVLDTLYGAIQDNVAFGFAMLIRYEDTGEEIWQDGDSMLEGGMYYVQKSDPCRNLRKDWDNYEEYFNWKELSSYYNPPCSEVWMGVGSCKRMMFTIVEYDKKLDLMEVQYPDGSTEMKSYSAIWGNKTLYILEE